MTTALVFATGVITGVMLVVVAGVVVIASALWRLGSR